MKRMLDVSIGQRLAFGFGLVSLVLLVFVAMLFHWQDKSAEAQYRLVNQVMPLSESAATLESTIFGVGIRLRSYLLGPTTERLQRYRQSTDSMRAAMQQLDAQPKESDGAALYRDIESLAQRYLREADRIVAQRSTRVIGSFEESGLAGAREAVVARLQEFLDLQERKQTAALAAVEAARARLSSGMIVASLLAALLFIVFARVTAQSIRKPAKELLTVASAFEFGDWRPALALSGASGSMPLRNEMRMLGRAFGAAAAALEQREQRMRADQQIAAAAASSLQKEAIAQAALGAIVEYVRAEVGLIYWREPGTDVLRPVARRALNGQVGPVHIGEGIPGLAAQERRAVVARDIPHDTPFRVRFGYDEAPPRAVAAAPIIVRDELEGVLLVASLHDIDEDALAFLSAAGRQLGIGFQNVRAFDEIERLLTDVNDKNQRIQSQNEELQAQNEEIQAQSEEIQAQSEELHAQNEELKRQADMLAHHAGVLAEEGERKNEFLSVLAHELRNPMAAITNSLAVMRQTGRTGELATRAQDVIERQARHLVRLIDDLIDVARIAKGKIEIQRERVDVAALVRGCIDDQRLAAEAVGVALKVDLPRAPVWIDGDATRLCQILGNLVNNALKFTAKGQSVAVQLRADASAGVAELRVRDNGTGIDPSLLPRLFDPFVQGGSRLVRSHGGLGLGLALVKTLAELHEGSVAAHSDGPGQGSEFVVCFPLKGPPAEPAVTQTLSKRASRRGCRVLIIDDNADVATSLRDLISFEHHEIEVAHAGSDGIERALAFRPHVVFCDIGLPGMSGYDVVKRFRRDERLRDAVLVALSGYASTEDKESAARAGFDFHLAKPPSLEHLNEILEQVAEKRRSK